MERIQGIDEAEIERVRQERLADTANGGDDDLNERIDANGFPTSDPSGILVDRKDREHIAYYQAADGSFQPYALKENDDVEVGGAFNVRIVGPGRERHYVACVWPEGLGTYEVIPIEASAFTARAPADSSETPWPIRPDEVTP